MPRNQSKQPLCGWIQGTGYTGEPGVEIFVPNDQANLLWGSSLAGSELGLLQLIRCQRHSQTRERLSIVWSGFPLAGP